MEPFFPAEDKRKRAGKNRKINQYDMERGPGYGGGKANVHAASLIDDETDALLDFPFQFHMSCVYGITGQKLSYGIGIQAERGKDGKCHGQTIKQQDSDSFAEQQIQGKEKGKTEGECVKIVMCQMPDKPHKKQSDQLAAHMLKALAKHPAVKPGEENGKSCKQGVSPQKEKAVFDSAEASVEEADAQRKRPAVAQFKGQKVQTQHRGNQGECIDQVSIPPGKRVRCQGTYHM